MTPASFLETRQAAWHRLETLIAKAGRKGVCRLTESELHELTRLYPAVAVDVSRARMYKLSPQTQQRINSLAIAAHGLLYRRKNARPFRAIWQFLSNDYPRLFRRLKVYIVLAAVLLIVPAVATYLCVLQRPSTAYLFVPLGLDMPHTTEEVTAEDISERFRQMPNSPMASRIMTNNISVAFNAFALGITAGIGTCYVLLINAMMLGGFFGHFTNHQLTFEFWSFIAPHGVLEIFAIIIAAASGLRMGISLAIPGRITRRASLTRGAREAVYLVLGTIPMFMVAGLIEGFITPSYIPGILKIFLGIMVWAMAMAYLLLLGRSNSTVKAAESINK